ncbi:MAG TPA: AraC family transcriptional regulator [Kiritimatiellia bacterium]|nr:AraC family transcriptional regulator [Kiritimatiellia bacterium]
MQPVLEKVPLTPDRLYLFWVRSEARFPFKWHFHPEYELTLIVRGRGTRVVGDRVEAYREGDLVLLGPNLPHTWSSARTSASGKGRAWNQAYILQFSAALFGESFLRQPEMARLAALLDKSRRGLQFKGRSRDEAVRLIRESHRENGLRRFARLLELFDVLAGAKNAVSLSTVAAGESSPRRRGTPIERIFRYIHERAMEQLGLDAVAKQFHMAPSTLHRRLKRETGRSLTELVNELRISHACGLLAHGDARIADICYQSGYQNLSYFNRRFRESTGMTPREYRRRILGEAA